MLPNSTGRSGRIAFTPEDGALSEQPLGSMYATTSLEVPSISTAQEAD
jgi:hypothetical protein